jgi:hypothetical protein
LGAIQVDPDAQPPKPNVLIERELRADIKYLLSKFYLYYSLLPAREALRDDLTKKAVLLTGAVVMVIALAIAANVTGTFFVSGLADYSSVVVTVLTVALAGIVGGCVSMLQRIQAAPSDGDALFNLAAMTNGWRGILLSPIYGAIFASLLFVLFAAGILNGSVFPTIVTPGWNSANAAPTSAATPQTPKATPSATQLATATPTGSPTAEAKGLPSPGPSIANQTEAQKSQSPTPPPTPTPSPSPRTAVLQIRDFLQQTGPRSGIA